MQVTKNALIPFILLFTAICADDSSVLKDKCVDGPRCARIVARHIEQGGIGYKQGYSSLDLFLTDYDKWPSLRPFLDLRGHVFDSGLLAANGGVGIRGLANSIQTVFGVNAYYDYRHSDKRHYHQVSGGLEILRESWDLRINGYFPVGDKETRFYNYFTSFNPINNDFVLTAVQEFAMKGMDAEMGWHVPKLGVVELYPAAGLYYYRSFGDIGVHTLGGRVRLLAMVTDYVSLEGILTYDHRFKWKGQGAIALNIPFGPRLRVNKYGTTNCNVAKAMQNRMMQPVQHNEIIVVDTERQSLK